MKITYTPIDTEGYTESSQRNPIRWTLLKKINASGYVNTTNQFKCKDYFNDFVIYKHTGKVFSAYGMGSTDAHFCPRGGLYVLVNNTTEQFAENVQNVLQPTFGDMWGASVEVTPVMPTELVDLTSGPNLGAHLLWFSPECLVSTFRISLLTLLIRNCNVDFVVNSYDERIDRNLMNDGSIRYGFYHTLKNKEFDFPEQADYCWYLNSTYNSKGSPNIDGYMLHNNGICSWFDNFAEPSRNIRESDIPCLGKYVGEYDGDDYDEDEEECECEGGV